LRYIYPLLDIRAALQIHDRSPKSRPVASLNQSHDADDATGRDRSWNATRPSSYHVDIPASLSKISGPELFHDLLFVHHHVFHADWYNAMLHCRRASSYRSGFWSAKTRKHARSSMRPNNAVNPFEPGRIRWLHFKSFHGHTGQPY